MADNQPFDSAAAGTRPAVLDERAVAALDRVLLPSDGDEGLPPFDVRAVPTNSAEREERARALVRELYDIQQQMQADDPAAPVQDGVLKLSTGALVTLRKSKGRDLQKAAAVAGAQAANPMSLMMGLIAQVALIDGRLVVYEEVLDMEGDDVMLLIGKMQGKEGAPYPPSVTRS